ncbi:HEAT repeat domain-containing protein [Neobacillus niacini]|uniref:HEAT repeat domain-containing protein n=1 Tax=Neobacillus niacini TaxID=86668 RepID=UPI00398377D5
MVNDEILFLARIAVALISLLFLLLVYLMIRKMWEIKKRKEIDSYKDKINPFFFSIIVEGEFSRALGFGTSIKLKAIEELLSRYVKILEGEEERKRLSDLASLYLQDYYRKLLKNRRWSRRMNALYHIEDFHMTVLKEDVIQLITKKTLSKRENVQVLRILASFQTNGFPDLLKNHEHYLNEYDYRSILMRLNQGLFEQFVLQFHKSSNSLQLAILDVISLKKANIYRAFTESVFTAYKGEVRIRALKALAEIGDMQDVEPCLEMMYSPEWQERMVAAKLIGSIKEERGIPRLIELLHDHSWWVRSQAGQSISQFPNGKSILQSVLARSKDAFARDMAWDWLHKGDNYAK